MADDMRGRDDGRWQREDDDDEDGPTRREGSADGRAAVIFVLPARSRYREQGFMIEGEGPFSPVLRRFLPSRKGPGRKQLY